MPGNAAIYIADPSLMGSRLFEKLQDIRSVDGISENNSATGVRFTLDAGQVTMNFMPGQQIAQHLRGFSGFAQQHIKDSEVLVYALARIQHVRLVCGCVITPDFDNAGAIRAFLFRFTRATNGLLFISNTIFDFDGRALS